ncbi:MAG TPA: response regulator transcription factor [Actinomycetes bacterium]|nr:response regulator transcription factor [Actinomycetes bacterium]
MTALVERGGQAHAFRTARFTALAVVGNPGVREAVVRRLHILGAASVAEAASIAEARARAIADGPRDLCVIDLSLPDGSGLHLLNELRQAGWSRCVALSPGDDPYSVRAALAAGVKGFVVTGGNAEVARTAPGSRTRGAGGPEGLSAREIEVLQLVAAGRSNRDIGGELNLSALTVKSHLARIARKLGTGDRAEMVAVALRAGVIA